MDIVFILLLAIFLFAIIYFAVRLAIIPLLYKSEEVVTDNQDFGLIYLRDIEVLNNTELEDVIKFYSDKNSKMEDYKQYQKYVKVLNELKEFGYYTDEAYFIKVEKLKKHFKID
ncbi:hypothetical protein KQI88_05405 [Alkaliphilus sp. MSJ-5]|uniref:SHOCT domain-containing protein n=1 Tax=Alkaliphilus flagellatus TaxID=2841507 RepID=A0ABS6G015_9FIRM|nr:hypothetical protein [Alkaliphilus flagellatus]MBU5675847.1 hypothetical protein [Alkaliphilus flagellatus]